uniref:Bravo_FIGEY domain-containing protein n=1 Tax=Macrostomum lignano TaxID=282301 RepID=A0A1I8HEX1_9PLAT
MKKQQARAASLQQSNGLCDVSDEDSGDAHNNGMSDWGFGTGGYNGVGTSYLPF